MKFRGSGHILRICWYCLVGIVLSIVLSFLVSCGSVKYIPVEKVKVEYINKTDTFIQRDSIHFRDSVIVERAGDTVTINKVRYVYKDKWRETVRIDSIIKTDSVQVPYPVERNLSKWEKVKMDMGGMAIGACLLLVLFIIIYLVIKRKK